MSQMDDYKEGEIVVNPETGKRLQLVRGEWKPIQPNTDSAAAMTHTKGATQFAPPSQPHMYMQGSEGEIKDVPAMLKFGAGLGAGMEGIGANIANMVSPSLVSDERIKALQEQNKPLYGTPSGSAGKFAGEMTALYPIGGAVTSAERGIANLVGTPLSKRLAQNLLLRGATEGAAQGVVTAEPDSRAEGATSGAMFGAAFPVGKAALEKYAAGIRPTRTARTLMNAGIELTPGQMNPSGSINQIEQMLMAVPVLGKAISGQRGKGYEQLQRAIGEEASPPNFKPKTIGDVNKLVDEIGNAYNDAYEVGKGYEIPNLVIMRDNGPNIPLKKSFESALTANANPDAKKYARNFLQNELQGLSQKQGKIMSDDLLAMRSRIRQDIRDLDKSQTAPYGASDILRIADERITDVLSSQLPPDVMPAVKAIDAKYGNFKILQDAVIKSRDKTGGFTPDQFSQAVRSGTTSKGTYAAGGGRMRPFAKAGQETFEKTEPMTGRMAVTAAPLAYGLKTAVTASPIATAAGLAGAGALWGTQAGRNTLAGNTAAQEFVRDLMRKGRRNLTPAQREAMVRLLQTSAISASDDVGQE